MRNYFSIKHYTLLKRKTAITSHRAILSFKLQRPTKKICEIAEGHTFSRHAIIELFILEKGEIISLFSKNIPNKTCSMLQICYSRNPEHSWKVDLCFFTPWNLYKKLAFIRKRGQCNYFLCSSQKLQECRASSSLTYFWLMLPFYTPWKKSQKTSGFLML